MCYFDFAPLMLSKSTVFWTSLLCFSLFPDECLTRTLTAHIGESVLFNVSCPPSEQPYISVWQRNENNNETVVYNFGSKSFPDTHYNDRTQMFLEKHKQNCSLVITNILLSDEGTYKLYYKRTDADFVTSSEFVLKVLSPASAVTSNRKTLPPEAAPIIGPVVGAMATLLGLAMVLLVTRRRCHHQQMISEQIRMQFVPPQLTDQNQDNRSGHHD